MTVAVCLKVQDGIVLASDSAATLAVDGGVQNVYNHANKVVNLRKGWALGAVSWGAGSIGDVSMSTLAKDLRVRLQGEPVFDFGYEEESEGESPAGRMWNIRIPSFQQKDKYEGWVLDAEDYTVEEVAQKMLTFLRDEHYGPLRQAREEAVKAATPEGSDPDPVTLPRLGMFIVGYSGTGTHAECFEIEVDEYGNWTGPSTVIPADAYAVAWRGQPEWIQRLVMGFGDGVIQALVSDLGLDEKDVGGAVDLIRRRTEVSLHHPAMPIQDAIDLATFLVDFTKAVVRFVPGAPIVGGQTEVAAITKHEGFKWVSRKHYYSSALNPLY